MNEKKRRREEKRNRQ